MKTKIQIEELTYVEVLEYFSTVGVIIEPITKEEIHEYYQNRLILEKYDKFKTIIDAKDWNHKITSGNGEVTMFCNESKLIDYSMQAIPPVTVTHK